MIQLGTLIDFIRGVDVTTPIYRTIAPLEVSFPVCTMTLNSSDVQQDLNGDINIETLYISLNCFGNSPSESDTLTDTIANKLATHKGTTGVYTISGFYLESRKSIDYADETSGKLVYGNQLDYRMTVKK